jgi:[ribosomal protein S18]-alanine N-acetyltransferase
LKSAADIRLRPPRLDDLEPVVRIEADCFDDPWPPASLLAELHRNDMRRSLIAEADKVIIGYVMAWLVADELHIINIAVSPQSRRGGVGSILLEAALQDARDNACRIATLEVRASNTSARGFYERFGFTKRGVREGYYTDNKEDALILGLDL